MSLTPPLIFQGLPRVEGSFQYQPSVNWAFTRGREDMSSYYHVKIIRKSGGTFPVVKLDLDEGQLKERVIVPYENGDPIVLRGTAIPAANISSVKITKTNEDSSKILPVVKSELAAGKYISFGITEEGEVVEKGVDVTDDFIRGAPGYKRTVSATPEAASTPPVISNRVFVVHGHDEALKDEAEIFLREIGLDPIVLHRKPDEGRTLIEKFEKYSDVSYAFVLLTPDDVGYPIEEESKPEKERKKEPRARQNVIFELGYFVGRLGRNRVCCLYKPNVSLPTDLFGILYKKITTNFQSIRYDLVKELKAAGYSDLKI